MVSKTVTVNLEETEQVRPVAMLVQKASQYDCKINILAEDKVINAKSIMGMMSLGIHSGMHVTLKADGEQEKEALEDIAEFLEN